MWFLNLLHPSRRKILNYLKNNLITKISSSLEQEMQYRTYTSVVMSEAKPKPELLDQQTISKKSKELMEVGLRHARAVVEEYKSGQLDP